MIGKDNEQLKLTGEGLFDRQTLCTHFNLWLEAHNDNKDYKYTPYNFLVYLLNLTKEN